MKKKSADEPTNDGRYDLRRATVLEVLVRNGVKVSLFVPDTDQYLLEKGEEILVFNLPARITLRHAVRLAGTFNFSHDQFYSSKNGLN